LLGDTQVSGGSIYTNDFQVFPLQQSYQELFSRLSVAGADRVQREGYYALPAQTGIFNPVSAGLTNFREPLEIWERGTVSTFAVTNAQPSTPAAGQLTLTLGSGLPTNAQVTGTTVEVYGVGGISDDVNDSWQITYSSPTSIILNGCTATGTFTSGGTVVFSSEQWSGPLDAQQSTDNFPGTNNITGTSTPGQTILGLYCVQGTKAGVIVKFPAATAVREIKLEYLLSSNLVTTTPSTGTDSMGIDDSLNFLSCRTAQYCGIAKGNPSYRMFQQWADYYLGVMLGDAAREMQTKEVIQPALWRPKRNVRWIGWIWLLMSTLGLTLLPHCANLASCSKFG
jgi:hypothetical protein